MDKRLRKLKIKFPTGWRDCSNDNPDGPPTFLDDRQEEPGVLQISFAEYLSGTIPNPDFTDLLTLSRTAGIKNSFGEIINEGSGSCQYGIFGKVEFSGKEFPYSAIWHISNGKNFVFATYICSKQPTDKELSEVNDILISIDKRRFLL